MDHRSESGSIESEVLEWAERLLAASLAGQTQGESVHAGRMAGLIGDPAAKGLAMAMTDRLIRSENAERMARHWRFLLSRFGYPRGLGVADSLLLRLGAFVSRWFPGPVIRAVRGRLRREAAGVILSAEPAPLAAYLAARAASGWRVNINPLGEAVLGQAEADRRLRVLVGLLDRPDVDYVSVKISSIFSQINLVAWDDTLRQIKDRLRTLYRAAARSGKFVNLDMEEYRDLALTIAAFRETLDEPEFRRLRAGVVLQAYLPESWTVLKGLTRWAQSRVAGGGAAIKVRLVKGANLAMERVEAQWHGWNVATYLSKGDTDANFRRMLAFACQSDHAAAVNVGVASHNLFDIALALVMRKANGVDAAVELEMLEGMANHQARAAGAAAGGMLVYSPIVRDDDFGSALAYLIRRLDENTSPDNFLSDLFALRPASPAWQRQSDAFTGAWRRRESLSTHSHRATLPEPTGDFWNEPDTDWSQSDRRDALHIALAAGPPCVTPPPAGLEDVDAALRIATEAQPAWESGGEGETAAEAHHRRAAVMRRLADVLSGRRFEGVAIMNHEGKKAIAEADTELSEAIDFARYYALTGQMPSGETGRAIGVVVIAPPWNFPLAIPCGGVVAALMAGNAVVLKPAPETAAIGWWLAERFWEAGVPREVLRFLACNDGETGTALIRDRRVGAVVLTGAYETARMFQDWRPTLPLFAETSGKNAIIITAMADRDLAAKDLVRSAFGHSGQKCSAASLGILESEVYDDPAFRRQICDAAASLVVGPASNLAAVATPLIRPPDQSLLRALTTLDPGEEWLLRPVRSHSDPSLWSPGIKLGVQPGSWFHQTECFGPVLGLMRASNLDEAIRWQNAVPFGLTAGIHSLDESETDRWRDLVQAGNAYINRTITGAIVRRQPFGGWKRSCLGPGAKAGGPNYVQLFRQWTPPDLAHEERIAASYRESWRTHFSRLHDPSGLDCEKNTFRYRRCDGVLVRMPTRCATTERLMRLASELTGTPVEFSFGDSEPDAELANRIEKLTRPFTFFRTLSPPRESLMRAVHASGMNWIDGPLAATGRVELTRWLREQSVTETWHRYGNLKPRLIRKP